MSATLDFFRVQIATDVQRALGHPVATVEINGDSVVIQLQLSAASVEQHSFWRAVREQSLASLPVAVKKPVEEAKEAVKTNGS